MGYLIEIVDSSLFTSLFIYKSIVYTFVLIVCQINYPKALNPFIAYHDCVHGVVLKGFLQRLSNYGKLQENNKLWLRNFAKYFLISRQGTKKPSHKKPQDNEKSRWSSLCLKFISALFWSQISIFSGLVVTI